MRTRTGWLIGILTAGIALSAPLLFAAVGELVSETAGVINIQLEGMMLLGAFCGVLAGLTSGSIIGAFAGAAIGGLALAALHGEPPAADPADAEEAEPRPRRDRAHSATTSALTNPSGRVRTSSNASSSRSSGRTCV